MIKLAMPMGILLCAIAVGAQQPGGVMGTTRYWDLLSAGADIQILRGAEGPVLASAIAGDDGRFQVGGLAPGTYLLRVRWGMTAQRVVTVRPNEVTIVDIVGGLSCPQPEGNQGSFSNAEMAELVRTLMLIDLEDRQRIAASTQTPFALTSMPLVTPDDMSRAWLARVQDLPLAPLNRRQLRQLAEKMTRVNYVALSEIRRTRNCGRIKVTHGLELDSAGRARAGLIGSSSRTYQFSRREARWEFDVIGFEEV
jgi:hypothetical protein